MLAVDKWRAYLQNQEFVIKTDHRSLAHITDQRVATKIQQKAILKMMDLQYRVIYKQGTANQAADALSRCPQHVSICAISALYPEWLEKVKMGYQDDPKALQLLQELSEGDIALSGFSLKDGIIRLNSKIWLGANDLAQQHILQAVHQSGVGGHSGFLPTYHRLKQLFTWPHMKQTIKTFIKQCAICQQAKVDHCKLPGLLQPLPIPDQAWKVVCLDFIEDLPKSNRIDTILVVIDKFTKYAHFVPLSHPFTALQVAQAYMDNIYKLHGLPESIVSDRDRIFTSTLWRELFKLSDTQLLMSSSYHPQTDGQTERLNQCLENFLRCSVHSCPKQWSKWLPMAEFWYNTSYHTALGRTPFEVLYGYAPKIFGIPCKGSSSVFQVQVLWSGLPSSLTTWEEVADLRRRYPSSPAWGQAGFQEGAIVRKPEVTPDDHQTIPRSAGKTTGTECG
jgi:hypothetical protein